MDSISPFKKRAAGFSLDNFTPILCVKYIKNYFTIKSSDIRKYFATVSYPILLRLKEIN